MAHFFQLPYCHLNGQGCPKCKSNKQSERQTLSLEEFIEKAIKVHGYKYNYSKVEYVNNYTDVVIICSKHGEFYQTPNVHMTGHGCPSCSNVKKYNTESFIEKAKIIHDNKYDYSKVNYINAFTKIEIICLNHGSFFQRPHDHLNKNGCPKCTNYTGEIAVRKFLTKYNIECIEQKKFDDCKDKGLLKFDFYEFLL